MAGEVISIFIILFRVLVPFVILKRPLLGAILAIIADASDVFITQVFTFGFLEQYPYIFTDKIFDIWYLFFEFIVVMSWRDQIAKKVAGTLFVWRFAGFLGFMMTGIRPFLLYAPNIFEFFFLACLIIWRYDKKFEFTWKKAGIVLAIVGIPNILKEYVMHVKFQDQTWNWIRDNVFWWIYK